MDQVLEERLKRWLIPFATLAALASLASRCGAPVCAPGETRCSGSEVQLCDPKGFWQTQMDCDDVQSPDGLPWQCIEAEATCDRKETP